MKKTVFIKNAAILTVSGLILRFLGIIFKVWLAGAIGSEGIGLYQLVFSVYVLAATFATSGISTAVTRLVADEVALGSKHGVAKIMLRSILLTEACAILSVAVLFFSADFIAGKLLGEISASPSIKILSLSLPFMGVCSCIRGYFIARSKATPAASSQIFEQICRIGVVFLLVKRFAARGIAYCCAAVLIGDVSAEMLACFMLAVLYFADIKRLSRLSGRKNPPFAVGREIVRISAPITLGRYLNSGLRTIESVLVPKNLAKYKFSGESALSQFGMIKGMALPVLFFPSTLLGSISMLLIPEMSRAKALGRKAVVKQAVSKILNLTLVLSYIFSAIFFVCGRQIGILIYKSESVGYLLRALSPIVPLMYLDSISDGILKGLDEQNFTFITSIADSSIRIILVILVLPVWGIKGFIAIMYASNLFTCLLNVGRLIKRTGAEVDFEKSVLFPILSAVSITLLFDAVISRLLSPAVLVYIILMCLFSVPLYALFLYLIGVDFSV